MVINAVVQPVQIRIGGQDFTENLVEASVYRSGIVFNGILHWHCSLTFNVKPVGPINLDDRNNSLLRRGQLIEITYGGLTRKLRVDKAFYDPIRFQLKVEGIDILELFSYRSPADSDLNNYTDQVSLSCGQVPTSLQYKTVGYTIAQLLSYAGIPSGSISHVSIAEQVNFYLDKDSNQSYVEMAAEIAAGFLYWMEVSPDETVVFHRFNIPEASIVYRHNHLLDFRRIEPLMEDPEIICVTGIKKRIVLPKQQFVFQSAERKIADDEVGGTREIENSIGSAQINYNPCNYYSSITFGSINSPRFTVEPKNGRGSYITEILGIGTSGLSGIPDYIETKGTSKQTFTSPDPPSDMGGNGIAFQWTSSLQQSGTGSGRKVTQKFYRWNAMDLLDSTFEVVVSWEQYLETSGNDIKQATIAVSGEATYTQYIYDTEKNHLKRVNIYSIRGVGSISELHEDEEDPNIYKTKSRVEKERVVNVVEYEDGGTAGVKRTSVEGERFVREVVYEGEEGKPRGDGSEYVTVAERQASSDSFFEYIDGMPKGEARPPLTSEEEEVIEAEYVRAKNINYLPRKKEIKVNWGFNREQLLEIAAWFSRYYVYKQNEYEVSVALEPRLWSIQGFVGCGVLGIGGLIDSISFAWTQDGRSECSFRLLGVGYYSDEIPPYPYIEYSISEPPSSTEKVVIRPIPNYEVFVGEMVSIPITIYSGVGPLQITVVGLPAELSFDADSKIISGIANSIGSYSITVTVIDEGDDNYSVSRSFNLTIRPLPDFIPFVPPSGKLDLACGGQLLLSFLNYARESWQVFYERLTGGAALQIVSRMNVFGLASGLGWKIEVRVTARGFSFGAGSSIRLYSAQSIYGLVSGSALSVGRGLVFGLGSGQEMGLLVADWLIDLVGGGVAWQFADKRAAFLVSGSILGIDEARVVGLASGTLLRVAFAYTVLRMGSGSSWYVATEEAEENELFDVLMAQSMNVEVGYIEQQVYD